MQEMPEEILAPNAIDESVHAWHYLLEQCDGGRGRAGGVVVIRRAAGEVAAGAGHRAAARRQRAARLLLRQAGSGVRESDLGLSISREGRATWYHT